MNVCQSVLLITIGCLILFLLISMFSNYIPTQNAKNIENFDVPTTTNPSTTNPSTTNPSTTKPAPSQPQRVRIVRVSDSQFQVHFYYPSNTVSGFIIAIYQYQSDMTPIKDIKILVTDETTGSTNAICSSAGASSTGGINCGFSHTFNDIAKLDSNGKNYLYRVAVAAVMTDTTYPSNPVDTISSFAEPENIPVVGNMKLFTMEPNFLLPGNVNLTSSAPAATMPISATSNTDFLNEGIDSQYNLLTQQLGGYPYNAVLSSTSSSQNLLADLVDKSMADRILNIQLS